MTSEHIKVAVVVVNYNGAEDIIECIESLFRLDYPTELIVVVDNGSMDQSLTRLTAYDDKITIISTGMNLGYAGGINVGLRHAMERNGIGWFFILNNDTIVAPDCLSNLLKAAEQSPEVGIWGVQTRYHHSPETLQTSGGGWFNRWTSLSGLYGTGKIAAGYHYILKELSPMYINGAGLFVPRWFIERVGFMCEDYFLYFEEVDWAIRARRADIWLEVAPSAVIYHKQGCSTGIIDRTGQRSLTADFYNIRNRLLIVRKYFPIALPMVYFTICISILRRLMRREFAAALQVIRILLGLQKKAMSEK